MRKIDFNADWRFKRLEEPGEGKMVTLPHDAMCLERRTGESRGRHNIGWFESYDYEYSKEWFAPKEYASMKLLLEFEGVYHNAQVYVNDRKVMYRPYGYTNFYVDLNDDLKYGQTNKIRVIAENADQPNSRWYTGSGIYRPVWLHVAEQKYILVNGVRIRTVGINQAKGSAVVEIKVRTSASMGVTVAVQDMEGREVFSGVELSSGETEPEAVFQCEIPDARLWTVESPNLYTCTVHSGTDMATERFGIRTLAWDRTSGLTINGERIILKGACIHHDNGLLGACAYGEAEERKIRLLKETGYNAIRSAHNPCSKALLDACDRLGMLVMDEYVDMWYIHKNEFDYASHMQEWWQEDLRDMVDKDYNHPSVILYSTGNEVAETGEKKGIELTGKMTEYLHSLDHTRPVSCGVNIFFNFLYSMGLGVYSDDKAKKGARPEKNRKKKTVGSEFYNTLAGMLGDKIMKIGAMLHMCDVKTRDAYANMDIAGYNYGIFRYRHDLKKYPNRLILGSETFCKDAYAFYEIAKSDPGIIGDFVWAGMDYIGEAGIGSWEYEDYAVLDSQDAGWLTAGSGRLDILGFGQGEAAYTKVALNKEQGPLMAVRPVYQKGKHSPSAWKMTDAKISWTWPECEGNRAEVEVYARAARVELFLNGKAAGSKKLKNTCNVIFKIPYEPGCLTCISYDEKDRKIGEYSLNTAGKETRLTLTPEKETLAAGEIGFIRLQYTDEAGIWKPMEKHHMKVEVENGTLLGFGNACPYNPDGYWKNTASTYYGEAMAVVRAGAHPVRVCVVDETQSYCVEIPVNQ